MLSFLELFSENVSCKYVVLYFLETNLVFWGWFIFFICQIYAMKMSYLPFNNTIWIKNIQIIRAQKIKYKYMTFFYIIICTFIWNHRVLKQK